MLDGLLYGYFPAADNTNLFWQGTPYNLDLLIWCPLHLYKAG